MPYILLSVLVKRSQTTLHTASDSCSQENRATDLLHPDPVCAAFQRDGTQSDPQVAPIVRRKEAGILERISAP